jgi:chromosome segregation ATPase
MTHIRKTGIVSILVVGLVAALVVPVQAQSPANFKAIDKLINTSQSTIGQIRATRLQIEETLNSYNAIIGGDVADNRKAYKQLNKNLNKTKAEREKVRNRSANMQAAADKLFTDWEASLNDISSMDLRERSMERMNNTKGRYDDLLAAGRAAGEEFDPFITNLNDQIVFLGNDLNPAAIAELEPDAKKLNAQAEDVFSKIDKALEDMTNYANSLKPE